LAVGTLNERHRRTLSERALVGLDDLATRASAGISLAVCT
jgi:hypothetical protein